ncbi:MAG: HU family DNA-binding protein [Pseudomonadota bacterium]
MNKKELVAAVAQESGLSKDDAGAAVDAVFTTIENVLKQGDGAEVKIAGFGNFKVTHREAREGVKPGTSEKMMIPAANVPKFQAGKGLKDAVNS